VAQKGTTISKEIEPARKEASVMKPPAKKDYSDSKKLKARKKEAVQRSPALPQQVLKGTVDKNLPTVQSQTKATAGKKPVEEKTNPKNEPAKKPQTAQSVAASKTKSTAKRYVKAEKSESQAKQVKEEVVPLVSSSRTIAHLKE
jgi:hypothetical protein